MFQVFENPDALLRKFDLEAVLQKIRDSMRQQYPLVRDVFRLGAGMKRCTLWLCQNSY